MSPDPSLDPNRTAAHQPAEASQPDTVDVTGERTDPATPPVPTDWPHLPGYEITAEIARGGMGRVHAGRDLTLDREVAIKTLLPGADAERFVTESKITARLPHPGIPPVHALGTLPDGSPYLVMKLIRGRTLAAVLKERPSPRHDLPRHVQAFEQVAQAVGFAHSRGVIHRDLKPLNVMVGEFGEVQVMDWGLAKDMASGGRQPAVPDEEQSADADRSPVHATRAGSVMGTPGYMAPEQARGEAVDARADVFALGSTLAAILTGKPAFVGTTARETIGKAAKADTADVLARLDACAADAELVALARRCLAAKAEDRPADARQVADEVAAYRAGVEARLRQAETDRARAETRAAEQAKRRRVVQWAGGVIAAVLLIGLAVSLWQMNRAVSAEGQAKTNEKTALDERDAKDVALKAETKALDAEKNARAAERVALDRARTALRSLTDEIVENQMARGTTLTEENKAFLRTILKQYEALAAITGDDAESRSIRAEGLFRVGLMRHRLSELQDAEAAYTAALALRRQLTADFPARPEFRQQLAGSHNNLGSLLHDTGRPKEAEAAYRDALALHKQLAADFPTRPEFQHELAGGHNNLGLLLHDTGRLKEAEAAYRDALALQKQLAADFPANPAFRRQLAASHNNLGSLLRDTSRLKEAEAAYRDALAIQKQLAADFPTVPQFRSDLAASHNSLGVLLVRDTGRFKEAEAAYRDALAIQKQLAADFPTVTDYQIELGGSCYNFGHLLSDTGKAEESLTWFADAIAVLHRLLDGNPMHPTARHFLRNSHVGRAQAYDRLEKYAESVKDWDRAVELSPANDKPQVRAGRADSRVRAGQVAEAVDEAADLTKLPGWPANQWYDFACIYAVAAGQDAAKKAEYADRAMELLQRAVKAGYKDAAHIKTDGDLDPLRGRADFKQLLATLEGKQPEPKNPAPPAVAPPPREVKR